MAKISRTEVFRAIKYTCFAASAGIIQIGTDILFNEVFHWSASISYLISLVLSVLWNFTFNRKFTFHSASSVPIAMLKVAAYYAVFTPLSFGWTWLLCEWKGELISRYIVEAATILINFVTEFLFQRFFVFKDVDSAEKQQKTEKENG